MPIDGSAQICRVVDTTGAGDAFKGGFLKAWLDGVTPDLCLEFGNRSAAIAIGTRGGFSQEAVRALSELAFEAL